MQEAEEREFKPDWVSPPGDTIFRCIEEKKIPLADFAEHMGKSITWVTRLVLGDEIIDEEVAEKLVTILGSTKQFWLKREENYRKGKIRLGL